MKDKTKPTDSEMDILQILWKHKSGTVRFVNTIQNETKKVGYTTTLKIMQIMVEKGILKRDESSRTHVYKPAIKEEDTKSVLVNKLLDSAFGGSAKNLVMHALGNYNASKEEINEIEKMLDKLEEEK